MCRSKKKKHQDNPTMCDDLYSSFTAYEPIHNPSACTLYIRSPYKMFVALIVFHHLVISLLFFPLFVCSLGSLSAHHYALLLIGCQRHLIGITDLLPAIPSLCWNVAINRHFSCLAKEHLCFPGRIDEGDILRDNNEIGEDGSRDRVNGSGTKLVDNP